MQRNVIFKVNIWSSICVRIGTITLEVSFGCQPSSRTLGLVWDNQNLLRGDGSLNLKVLLKKSDQQVYEWKHLSKLK